MPRYRLNARSFIKGSLQDAGAEVDFDGVPGSNLDPLDDEARAAKEAAAPARRAGMRAADGKRPVEPGARLVGPEVDAKRKLVEIPEGWRDLPPEQRINLARQLGAPVKGTNAKKADETIETEIARRATV
jgi:hypothetical protein